MTTRRALLLVVVGVITAGTAAFLWTGGRLETVADGRSLGRLWDNVRSWLIPDGKKEVLITATVARRTLPIVVTVGGELESAAAVDVVCPIPGQQHKIIELLPEGSQVKKGDVVVRLDPAVVTERVAVSKIKVMQDEAKAKISAEELKIQQNLAASKVAQAELALKLADLDKKKFLEGEYQAFYSDLQGLIALARASLQEAEDTVGYYRDLVKKGFRTPEQLKAKEQAVERAAYYLNRDEERLKVLEKFTRERQEVELTAKAIEAQRELDRAKSSAAAAVAKAQSDADVDQATARLGREQLDLVQQQLKLCEVRAPTDGVVVYVKKQDARIDQGSVVYYKQKLFSVPEMSKMRVQAWVHESEVKRVEAGMRATIRVDALPEKQLHGTVTDVATFYNGDRHWLSGGVKDYATTIDIEDLGDAALKPGMTSQVTIHVGELENSLLVPLAAVTEKDGQYFAFVVNDQGVARRPVSIGAHTEDYVEITQGLSEGERVALDARRRAAEGLKDAPPQDGAEEPSQSDGSLASR